MSSWHRGRGALEWGDPAAYYDSRNVWTHIRGQVTLAALQNPTTKAAAASVNGAPLIFRLFTTSASLYVGTGGASRDIFSWDNTNTVWVGETSGITADPTDMEEFQGAIWVGQGNGTVMRVKPSGGSWGNAAAGVDADFLVKYGEMVLYRSTNINELYWTTESGGTPAWNGPLYVGDTNTQIRGMAVGDGKVWIGKDDGLYVLENQVVTQVLDFQWHRDANNFRHMRWWQGALYFPIGHGLYRLVGTSLQSIGPNRGAPGAVDVPLQGITVSPGAGTYKGLASGKRGQIVDLVPTGEFLDAVVDVTASGGTSQVLRYNGEGWHQLIEAAATDKRIRAAFFTGPLASTGTLAIPRMWFGYDVDVYNIRLPLNTDDPFEDTVNQTYADPGHPNAYVESPWFDAGLSNVYKEWQAVEFYTENLDIQSGEFLALSYQVNDIATWTIAAPSGDNTGSANFVTVSPYLHFNLPPHTIGKKIRVRIGFDRGATTTKTPKLKAIVMRLMVRPATKYAWQITARTGGKLRNPYTRTAEQRDPAEWMQLLMRMRDSRNHILFDDGDIEPAATNLLTNPDFLNNSSGLATNWSKVGAPTTAISYRIKYRTIGSQRVITAATGSEGLARAAVDSLLTAGLRYTASVYLYAHDGTSAIEGASNSTGDPLYLEVIDASAGNAVIVEQRITDTNRWLRPEVTWVHGSGQDPRIRVVRRSGDATGVTVFYLCAAQLEEIPNTRFSRFTERATSYIDGNQPRCRWDDTTVLLSRSSRPGAYRTFVTNINRIEIVRPGIMDRIRGKGIETRITLTLAQVD